jgi:hypothetical protein
MNVRRNIMKLPILVAAPVNTGAVVLRFHRRVFSASPVNGSEYVSEFKNNKFNGQGSYADSDGAIDEGIFKDSVYLGTVAEAERAEKTHSVYQLVNRRCDP